MVPRLTTSPNRRAHRPTPLSLPRRCFQSSGGCSLVLLDSGGQSERSRPLRSLGVVSNRATAIAVPSWTTPAPTVWGSRLLITKSEYADKQRRGMTPPHHLSDRGHTYDRAHKSECPQPVTATTVTGCVLHRTRVCAASWPCKQGCHEPEGSRLRGFAFPPPCEVSESHSLL